MHRRLARQRQIAEFLVLKRRVAALERLVQPRPLNADGEVAPVFPRHRAGFAPRRARRGDICAQRGQMRPNGAQVRKALRRARLDEDEHLLAGIPELFRHRQAHGGLQLAEHIPLADELRAGQWLPRRQIAGRPLRLHAPGLSHQPLADGAHRRLALQARRPLQRQQRIRRERHSARPRAAIQHRLGRKAARLQRLGQRRPRGLHRRGHPGQRIGRRLALARQQALSLARLEAIRLADGARIPFKRSPCVIRRDRFQRALPIRHIVLRRFICF